MKSELKNTYTASALYQMYFVLQSCIRELSALTGRLAKKLIIRTLAVMMVLVPFERIAQPFVDDLMLDRLNQQYSAAARHRGVLFNKLFNDLSNKTIKTQLIEVNRFFNQFNYKDDLSLWGKKDYRATPEEFIGVNGGDCEDYVVAKYFALRALGVPDDRLYLTYVKALNQNIAHMVLSYFETPKSIPLILDNYNPQMLSADKRPDLLPVYSFNAQSLFLSNASAGLGRSLPTDKIKNNKWQSLLASLKRSQP